LPRRLLRDGILRSKRVNSLTAEAELFYRRLMSVVDDFGRYEADPEILLSACYPLNRMGICVADVTQMLRECVATAPQLIRMYENGGSVYLEVVKFNQETRSKPKFPGPDDTQSRLICDAVATQLGQEDVIPKTFSEDVFTKTLTTPHSTSVVGADAPAMQNGHTEAKTAQSVENKLKTQLRKERPELSDSGIDKLYQRLTGGAV
jgi:hypothetical protein